MAQTASMTQIFRMLFGPKPPSMECPWLLFWCTGHIPTEKSPTRDHLLPQPASRAAFFILERSQIKNFHAKAISSLNEMLPRRSTAHGDSVTPLITGAVICQKGRHPYYRESILKSGWRFCQESQPQGEVEKMEPVNHPACVICLDGK